MLDLSMLGGLPQFSVDPTQGNLSSVPWSQRKGGFMDKFNTMLNPYGGLLGDEGDLVRQQGLLGLASGLLAASGPSTQRVSLGQALGQGLQGMQQGQASAAKNIMAVQKMAMGGEGPASVQEWKYYNSLPEADQKRYLEMKRSMYSVNNIGNVPTLVPHSPGMQTVPLSTLPAEARGKATVAGAERAATESAQTDAEKQRNAPKAASALRLAEQRASRVTQAIDAAVPNVGYWTAGLGGASLDKIPGSPARDLRAQIDTIKANIGFDELNQMRQSSPTGGALGNVSEREIAYLQSVLSNLEQSQSPEQLRQNLLKTKEEIAQSWERVRQAYEADYGRQMVAPGNNTSNNDDPLGLRR